MHLYCVKIRTTSKRTETSFRLSVITYEYHWVRPNDFRAYGTFDANHVVILRQDYHYLQTDRNELPLELRHLGVPSDTSKTIFEPMVRLAQTIHLSCTDTNTVSERTEARFHVTHVT